MEADIFIGPTYYMRLKHLVKDKINYRAKGPRTLLTRQTVQGRANDGGLRVGEQERDAIVGHGLAYFLQESMLVRGDEYFMAICNVTGMISIYNNSLNLFMSPLADGPIQYTGGLDGELKIDKITRFGREFSIVRVPYAFKLLLQELGTMNICMRIITEDNISQISSMSFGAVLDNLDEMNMKVKSVKNLTEPTKKVEEPKKSLLEDASIEETSRKQNSTDNMFKQYQVQQLTQPSLEIGVDIPLVVDSLDKELEQIPSIKIPTLSDQIPDRTISTNPVPVETILDSNLIKEKPVEEENKEIIVGDVTLESDDPEKEKYNLLTDVVDEKSGEDEKSGKEKSIVME